jgi:hypothetical protein
MGILGFIFRSFILFGVGIFVFYEYPSIIQQVLSRVESYRKYSVLESRYDLAKLAEIHRSELTRNGSRILDTSTRFYPYALMHVKYSMPSSTEEGVILWDLLDGEMVLSTRTWEKTRGFRDCLIANASCEDMQILTLFEKMGQEVLHIENIVYGLQKDRVFVNKLLDRCHEKKLVVLKQKGIYRLHICNPKLMVSPKTDIHCPILAKEVTGGQTIEPRYSLKSVSRIAENAFGKDFTVQEVIAIYLPVCVISLEDQAGAISVFHFNSLNGQRWKSPLFYH